MAAHLELIGHYFKDLSKKQIMQFESLYGLYEDWNSKINVISRKDMEAFYMHHVLHSLAIAKVIQFKPGTTVLDVGTGGGFPGIPLAILFPETEFLCVDSTKKKISVVNAVIESLNLNNCVAEWTRVEDLKSSFDFVVSRGVTAFPQFYAWVKDKLNTESKNDLPNGILFLKGGDLIEEFISLINQVQFFDIKEFYQEEFFETKKVVYMAVKNTIINKKVK
jgi:16S rRNA (guanine527-N7)-methyltransferase